MIVIDAGSTGNRATAYTFDSTPNGLKLVREEYEKTAKDEQGRNGLTSFKIPEEVK